MSRTATRHAQADLAPIAPPFQPRQLPATGISAAIAQVMDEAAEANAKAVMDRILIEQQIAALAIEDGEEATLQLSKMGWLLTWATETAVNVPGLPPAKRTVLHTALHLIQGMCLLGYTWRATAAPTIDYAIGLGHQILQDHAPTAKTVTHHNADHFAAMIQQHKVLPESVVGLGEYVKTEVHA